MLSSQLAAIQETMPIAGLDRLAEHLPLPWIEEALACAGSASIRRRRLPAEQVVWLVIALALYRHQSMPEVLATLNLAVPHEDRPFVSKSAITQARQRLPDGVAQEIWGALIAYNLVRPEMAKAAIDANVAPTDLSFLQALHILQHELVWAAGMSPGRLPIHLARLRFNCNTRSSKNDGGEFAPASSKHAPPSTRSFT
jgi:hypothetical protein